jgi:hypothetical protein
MNPVLPPENEGDRPSRLDLDRFATGELKGDERRKVQIWLDKHPEGFAHLESLRDAKKAVKPLDLAVLRARAGALPEPLASSAPAADELHVPDHVEGFGDPHRAATFPPGILEPDEDKSTQPFAEERVATPARDSMPILDESSITPPAPEPRVAVDNRASAMASAPDEAPPANNNRAWLAILPILALAAVLALVAVPMILAPADPALPGLNHIRGATSLSVFRLEGGALAPYTGEALGAGDVVGFQVLGGGARSVVVLSVDGTGAITAFDEKPEALDGTAESAVSLPGSVTLDGAPGPEVFVAVFDADVPAAKAAVAKAWADGGAKGVVAWAKDDHAADAVVVERK